MKKFNDNDLNSFTGSHTELVEWRKWREERLDEIKKEKEAKVVKPKTTRAKKPKTETSK